MRGIGIWLALGLVFSVSHSVVRASPVPRFARPNTDVGLAGFPIELIQDAEREAWIRTYNNFVYNDDRCFDRANDVIAGLDALMRARGISFPLHLDETWTLETSNVAKLLIIYPRANETDANGQTVSRYRWYYHVVAVLRDDHGNWHPIDPDGNGVSPATPEAWVESVAHDIHGASAKLTGLAVGKLYPAIPPADQVYVYWMPANFYEPEFSSGDPAQLLVNDSQLRDPIQENAQSVQDLQAHRAQLLAEDATRKVSGADVLGLSDADHDGIPDDVDRCPHTPASVPSSLVSRSGWNVGCGPGETPGT